MPEQPNRITPEQTAAIAAILDHEASTDAPPCAISGWQFTIHPGKLPGLLIAVLPDGTQMKLRLVLEEMPVFGVAEMFLPQ